MDYRCEIREQAAQPTLCVRATAAAQDLPRVLDQAFGAVMQYVRQLGQCPAGAPYVAYLSPDVKSLKIEAGVPMRSQLPGQGEIVAGEMVAGTAVTCLYTGPYDEIGLAYTEVWRYLREQGYEAGGVVYEVYLSDPKDKSPSALQTQIIIPLKAKG